VLEFREDAPIGMLIFWSIALVVWLVIKFRSRKTDVRQELKRKNRENSE
jgi:hypothetical protein